MEITIKPASNGLIKTIYESAINGVNSEFESDIVYNFDNQDHKEQKVNFIYNLLYDLGIEIGSESDPSQLKVHYRWGDNYNPTQDEIQSKINELEKEKKKLEGML